MDELAALTGKAAKEAAGVKPPLSPKPATDLTPESLDKAVEKTKEKAGVDVKGSFSAAGLRGAGFGDSIEKQVDEQKKTNQKLDKLDKTVEKNKAVFS